MRISLDLRKENLYWKGGWYYVLNVWKDDNGIAVHFPLFARGHLECYKLGHWSKPLTYR